MTNSLSNLSIKRAGVDDARLLAIIGTVSFYEAYFEQDTPIVIANYLCDNFSVEQMTAELNDPNAAFFIALQNEKAVGYAKLLSNAKAEGVSGSRPIELKRIYLVERVWGSGIGEALLSHCEDFGRSSGHDTIWLGVWQENQRGQRFYAKHGFSKVGTITFPYGDSVGINDVMEKPLRID